MLKEIETGSFFSYESFTGITEYQTPLVDSDEPWGTYTISALAPDVTYTAVFAAASEYKASQLFVTASANTAEGVPVTANSYRAPESFTLHTKIPYSSADERAFAQAVIKTLKEIGALTQFLVTLPTARIVTVKFINIEELWPFALGEVDIIIQCEEYNPFPIFADIQTVNKQYNGFFGNQGRIKGAPKTTTITPVITSESS